LTKDVDEDTIIVFLSLFNTVFKNNKTIMTERPLPPEGLPTIPNRASEAVIDVDTEVEVLESETEEPTTPEINEPAAEPLDSPEGIPVQTEVTERESGWFKSQINKLGKRMGWAEDIITYVKLNIADKLSMEKESSSEDKLISKKRDEISRIEEKIKKIIVEDKRKQENIEKIDRLIEEAQRTLNSELEAAHLREKERLPKVGEKRGQLEEEKKFLTGQLERFGERKVGVLDKFVDRIELKTEGIRQREGYQENINKRLEANKEIEKMMGVVSETESQITDIRKKLEETKDKKERDILKKSLGDSEKALSKAKTAYKKAETSRQKLTKSIERTDSRTDRFDALRDRYAKRSNIEKRAWQRLFAKGEGSGTENLSEEEKEFKKINDDVKELGVLTEKLGKKNHPKIQKILENINASLIKVLNMDFLEEKQKDIFENSVSQIEGFLNHIKGEKGAITNDMFYIIKKFQKNIRKRIITK